MLVLTGASGWFGKNALHALEKRIGPENLRAALWPVASRAQVIDFGSPCGPIRCYPLETLNDIEHPTGVLHTAFLKRSHIADVGAAAFVDINRRITRSVTRLLEKNSSCPVVAISSGVAAGCSDHTRSVTLAADPYAVLKCEEEEALRKRSNSRMIMVFRVYAASGRFLRVPTDYALGSFVQSALQRRAIEIRATGPVWRSYVNAGDLMALSWDLLLQPLLPGYSRIDACTETLEIETLARNVVDCLGGGPVLRRLDPNASEDRYVADPDRLISLMQYRGITIKALREQIIDTAIDIRSQGGVELPIG